MSRDKTQYAQYSIRYMHNTNSYSILERIVGSRVTWVVLYELFPTLTRARTFLYKHIKITLDKEDKEDKEDKFYNKYGNKINGSFK